MIIIGINAWHGDASAALIVDGKVVSAMEEERFTRIKHWAGFPAESIKYCLKENKLEWKDIDYFAIGRDPKAKIMRKAIYTLRHFSLDDTALQKRLHNRRNIKGVDESLSKLSMLPENSFAHKVKYVEHHRSHLASAYFCSPFDHAACMSIDGSGDFTTTMAGVGVEHRINVLKTLDFPHSLGIFYSAFTQFLGFHNYGDEYKIMGLAPYGKPVYKNKILDLFRLTKDGLFQLDLSYFRKGTEGIIDYDDHFRPVIARLFSPKLVAQFGENRKENEPLNQFHKDMAASVQTATEEVIFYMLRALYNQTKNKHLCLAGGVAQNSVANGKILSSTPFEKLYIPPAAHDAGISIGAALSVYYDQNPQGDRYVMTDAFIGSSYCNDAMKQVLIRRGVEYKVYEDDELFDRIVDRLVDGAVIGWFSGKSEFGPRALGGRSILGDPTRSDMKDIINSKIKRRESFRPFAPSILKENVSEYFEEKEPVPFMEKVYKIKVEKRGLIPAVTHVDGTGRVQTVDEKSAPRYYRLIQKFKERTGVPILLNTSFNENEPIVRTPQEALDCFLRTDMDVLVLENIFIEK